MAETITPQIKSLSHLCHGRSVFQASILPHPGRLPGLIFSFDCGRMGSIPNSSRLPADSSRLCALISATALLAATPSFAAYADHAWKIYTNDRFGFSVCYPSDLLRQQAAPDNNEGQTFIGSNGAKIAAWGSFNAMDWTLADSMREDEKRLDGGGGTITYKVIQNGFYVLSGRKGDQIFYNRGLSAKFIGHV
jgi:hypothetical protein